MIYRSAVVDTSAVIRLFVPDGPLPDGFLECVEAGTRGDIKIMAPELMLAELGQVLRKKEAKSYLSKSEITEIIENILLLPINYTSHTALIQPAIAISRKSGLTVYDSIFIALSHSTSSRLFSADEKLLACS